jgi:hypothetical protein
MRAAWRADLSPGAKVALLELGSYLNYKTGLLGKGPRVRICEQLGYSKRQATNLLQELKGKGFIVGDRINWHAGSHDEQYIAPEQDIAPEQYIAPEQDVAPEQDIAHQGSNNVLIKGAGYFPPYQHSTNNNTNRETQVDHTARESIEEKKRRLESARQAQAEEHRRRGEERRGLPAGFLEKYYVKGDGR